jgi:hypothetical protein
VAVIEVEGVRRLTSIGGRARGGLWPRSEKRRATAFLGKRYNTLFAIGTN